MFGSNDEQMPRLQPARRSPSRSITTYGASLCWRTCPHGRLRAALRLHDANMQDEMAPHDRHIQGPRWQWGLLDPYARCRIAEPRRHQLRSSRTETVVAPF